MRQYDIVRWFKCVIDGYPIFAGGLDTGISAASGAIS
jgi:hypothetical protein